VSALQRQALLARRCYRRALAAAAPKTIAGKTVVSIVVTETGAACGKRIVSSDMPDEMNDCVLAVFDKSDFPPPEGGCLEVNIPLSFSPQT
jgi:hypothetical protein